jgi:hypothetical protein
MGRGKPKPGAPHVASRRRRTPSRHRLHAAVAPLDVALFAAVRPSLANLHVVASIESPCTDPRLGATVRREGIGGPPIVNGDRLER